MNDNTMSPIIATFLPVITATVCVYLLEEEEQEDNDVFTIDDIEMMIQDELRAQNKKKRRHVSDVDDDNSPPRKKRYLTYNRQRALMCVDADYFGPRPTFDDRQFERFLRISPTIAEYILQRLAHRDKFWTQTYDARKRMSNSPKVKLLAALKMASYGESFSAWQDYFQMGESTARECLSKLMRGLVLDPEISGKYLRKMTKSDAQRVEALHREQHGIAGMLGSLDVWQIPWGNCPSAQKGQHTGKAGYPTLGLEAAADYNLWIWHWNFGSPGSLNDINIWERSSMLEDITHGRMSEIDFDFKINGETFSMLYYLVDLIYPKLARFLRAISVPRILMDRNFTSQHDGWRKDIERAFGVIEKKFHCLTHPIQLFYMDDIYFLVGGCIVLHNMMVEERVQRDQRESESFYELVADQDPQHGQQQPDVSVSPAAEKVIADEEAYFADNAARANLDNEVVDLDFREELYQHQLLSRNLRFVQHYWKQLADVNEHMRLQNAVKHQLYKDAYGHDTHGNDVANFDPFADCIL